MNLALKIILFLAIASQMNCATWQNESSSSKRELLKLPDAICKPAKAIGKLIADGVVKCAKDALNKKKTRRAQAVQKPLPLTEAEDLSRKLVAALLSKVGCARRLNVFDDIASSAKKVNDNIKSVFKKAGDKVKAAFTPKKRNLTVFDDIASGFKKAGDKVKALFVKKAVRRMNVLEDIKNGFKKLGDKVKEGFNKLTGKDKRRMTVLEDIKNGFKKLGDKVKSAFTPKKARRERRLTVLEDIKNGFKKLGDKVKKGFESLAPKKHLRRMSFLDTIAKGFKKLGEKVKKGFESIGKSALKLACKAFKSQCPKACDSAVDAVTPMMKALKIPTKCSNETAKGVCHTACKALCKGQ